MENKNPNWGGRRAGAGRPAPAEPKRKHSIYCTEQELEQVRRYLAQLRTTASADTSAQ